MYRNNTFDKPDSGSDYVPYFYASGRFAHYQKGHHSPASLERSVATYDFTSDLTEKQQYRPQTVEQVIRHGYLAVPKQEPDTALLSDRQHTARLGLTDVIKQIRRRYEIYHRNLYELQVAQCEAINCLYRHRDYHGPTDRKTEYQVSKRINELYQEQREQRVNLWRDVSRLRLQLPENAQQYLAAHRKVAILEQHERDAA